MDGNCSLLPPWPFKKWIEKLLLSSFEILRPLENRVFFFTSPQEKPSSFEIILKLCNRNFHLHPDQIFSDLIFILYFKKVPRNKFELLRYIPQQQNWKIGNVYSFDRTENKTWLRLEKGFYFHFHVISKLCRIHTMNGSRIYSTRSDQK